MGIKNIAQVLEAASDFSLYVGASRMFSYRNVAGLEETFMQLVLNNVE